LNVEGSLDLQRVVALDTPRSPELMTTGGTPRLTAMVARHDCFRRLARKV
jgi:hypothetical protein